MLAIEREAAEVDIFKHNVEADKERANKAAMEAQAIKDECEDQLDSVMPSLNEATLALNTLKPQDISCIIRNKNFFS